MQFDRKDWSHFAAGLTMLDWAVAVPSYPLAPTATIPQIGGHIADAITLAAGMVNGPIVLTGHSAGGQLVARMAMENAGLGPDVAARIHNIVPISPVGDLRPLLQTGMNSRLGLNAETAVAESPSLHAKHMKTQVHTWVGADERPAFLAQAKQLADAWNGPLTVEPDRHHFDVIDGLLDPEHPLCRAIDLA
ncbi:MAG: alpha/beta hydrolase [Planktomarina sp.]